MRRRRLHGGGGFFTVAPAKRRPRAMTLAPPSTEALKAQADARDSIAGILWMVFAVFVFVGMDAMAKWQTETYPVVQIIFFRAVFGTLVLLPFLLRGRGIVAQLKTKRSGLHFVRSMIGCLSLFAFFLSYRYLALADAIAISFVSPLFMTALSVPFLREHVGWRRWCAIGVGFMGVLVIVRPGGGLFTIHALLPVLGAFTYALVGVTIRLLSRTESPVTIVFYFGVFSSLVAGAALPFFWVTPVSAIDWIGQIGIGLIGGIAQLAMTNAFRLAPVSVASPFEYTGIVWAALVGFLVWGDLPAASTWGGAALVIGSGLYILHRQTLVARGR